MPLAALALLALQGGLLPAFPEAWTFVSPLAERHDGSPVAQVPAATGEFAATGALVPNPPTERELRFSVWMRPASDGPLQINAFADGADGALLKAFPTTVPGKAGEWALGRATVVAPPGTARLRIYVIHTAKTPLDVSGPRLELGEAKVAALNGAGLLRASAGMPVAGGAGTVLFPIPGPTAESAPVAFVLRAAPASALKGYDVRRREGDNWVCEARIDGPASLRWEALVAVRDARPTKLPKAKIGPVAANLKPYLAASPVVQSDDPAIRAKAKALRRGADDAETYARRVIAFTSANEGTGRAFVSLDASCALASGGSCTSRANLGAALLRAGGVPARTVSHLPTFADGSPLYEHWLVEYWHPGAGWTRLETTLGVFRPKASGFAPLATASLADERMTGKPGQLGWIMPGAAWMSGIQGTGALHPAGVENDGNANWCRPARRMAVDAAFLKAARAAWPRLATGHPELMDRAMSTTPGELAKALSGL